MVLLAAEELLRLPNLTINLSQRSAWKQLLESSFAPVLKKIKTGAAAPQDSFKHMSSCATTKQRLPPSMGALLINPKIGPEAKG